MPPLTPRRVRSGHYEWQCHCGQWYAKLPQHIHRFHIKSCKCLAGGELCKRRREGRESVQEMKARMAARDIFIAAAKAEREALNQTPK